MMLEKKMLQCLAAGLCHPPVSKLLPYVFFFAFCSIPFNITIWDGFQTFPLRSAHAGAQGGGMWASVFCLGVLFSI
jgi:hypothetical protein